ncbi:N-acetylglucosamine kinase [Pseudonocardia sichuanensis]
MDLVVTAPDARLFLAVDGGTFATDAALLTPAGEVLARVRAGSTSPQSVGAVQAASVVERLRGEALARAGLPASTPVARVVAFVAGVDLPEEREDVRAALAAHFAGTDLVVENDIHAVLWAGMRRPAGVAVKFGSGINALARSATGRTAGYLALGTISGDWGGALTLGSEVLFAASRAEDGRGPHTSLRYRVAAHFARPTVRQAVADLHRGRAGAPALADLTSLLLDADADGDPVARQLVDRQAQEVVTMAAAAMNRANVPTTGSDVVLAGSLLTAGHERLDRLVDDGVARALPGAVVRRMSVPAVVGAALACLGAERGGPIADERYLHRIAESLEAATPSR